MGKLRFRISVEFGSNYNDHHAQAVKVGDYKVPMKNANTMSKLLNILIS